MSIICDGEKTSIKGSTLDIIQDFANVIHAVNESFREEYTPDETEELIALCGQLAFVHGNDEQSEDIIMRIVKVLKN